MKKTLILSLFLSLFLSGCDLGAVEQTELQTIYNDLKVNDKIAEITDEVCFLSEDCKLPGEYAMRSSCPYTVKCVNQTCMIICPEFPQVLPEIEAPVTLTYPSEMNRIANGEWETYRNEKYGVEFGYPSEFQLEEELHYTYEDGKDWYRIWVKNPDLPENPVMLLEINPDGYGPVFPDKHYDLTQSDNAKVEFLEESIYAPEEYNQDGIMFIVAAMYSDNENMYSWHFTYQENGEEYETLFKDILATYKFF
ncbi:hypothetical protein KKD70_00665 [Patescibacteria group bacterium]|nr:hypothetical protein [Patescibacteria group bacterium]